MAKRPLRKEPGDWPDEPVADEPQAGPAAPQPDPEPDKEPGTDAQDQKPDPGADHRPPSVAGKALLAVLDVQNRAVAEVRLKRLAIRHPEVRFLLDENRMLRQRTQAQS